MMADGIAGLSRLATRAAGEAFSDGDPRNFIVVRTFPILNDSPRVGPAVTFWIYSAISLLAFVMVLTMVPETKGRSLEQIEAYWEGLSQVRR